MWLNPLPMRFNTDSHGLTQGSARAVLLGLSVGLAGWFLLGPLLGDFRRAVAHPAPLVYTEGVMMWASQEVDRAKSPYGAIEDIPSRYFCYGPAVPVVVSWLGADGPSYLRAGRTLSGVALLGAAILCGILASRLGAGLAGGIAAGVFFLLSVFCGHHAWSFRVDTTVVALGLGGCIAGLSHAQGGGARWLLLAGACGALGGLTKFTSCFWALWIFLLCGGGRVLEDQIRRRNWTAVWKGAGGAVCFGTGWLGGTVAMEIFYPGAIGDQVFGQAESGFNPWGYTRNTIIDASAMTAVPWAAAVAGFILGGGGRIVGIAGAAWVLAAGMLLKFGSDINYFFDSFALIAVAAAVTLTKASPRLGGTILAGGAVASFFLMANPVRENMPHRMTGEEASRELVASRESAYLFRGNATLCEDPFFPVYHGGAVLVSDPFQASLNPLFSDKARRFAEDSGRIVSGERIGRALGGELWGNFVGARWTRAAGVPGVGVYLPSDSAKEVRRRHPSLRLQTVPSEIRFFAQGGEVLDWGAVAYAFGKLGGGRRTRLVTEDTTPLDYRVLSGDGGTGGW
jgi:hypothetical protein